MVQRMAAFAVAFMALAALMAAGPAVAQQYPPAENLMTLSDTTPCPGQTVTGDAQTFPPDTEIVVLELEGGGPDVNLEFPAATGGRISYEVPVPVGHPLGPAQITATGMAGDRVTVTLALSVTVEIVPCNETPPPTTPGGRGGGGNGGLPRTGADTTMTLVRVGLALAAAGGVLLALSTKRRRRTKPALA